VYLLLTVQIHFLMKGSLMGLAKAAAATAAATEAGVVQKKNVVPLSTVTEEKVL